MRSEDAGGYPARTSSVFSHNDGLGHLSVDHYKEGWTEMSMPSERTRSVILTEAFLRELSKSPSFLRSTVMKSAFCDITLSRRLSYSPTRWTLFMVQNPEILGGN